MTNLLTNGGFNGGWTRETHTGQEFGEIFVPEGWIAYWDESQSRPEMHVIEFVAPFIDPPRVIELPKAVKWFSFWRNCRAGIYERVTVVPGARYRFAAQAHAWYSQRDNPHRSEYEDVAGVWHTIENGDPGMAFSLSVDLQGRNDPWESVPAGCWESKNVYDAFGEIALEFVATGDAVTVFIESATMYPFKHCDAYVDDARLELIEAPEPPPGVDYVVVVELLPQDFTLDEIEDVVERTFEQRRTFLQSADDAVRLVVPGLPGSRVDVWEPSRFYGGDIVQWLHDRGVEIVDVYYLDGGSPPPPPPPDWTPRRYIPTGLTVGFMGLGNCGLPQLYNGAGVTAPTIKLQQAIWDIGIMPAQFRTVRLDDWPPLGYRFSGFDYLGDPIAQAETRMSQLLPLLEPLRGQFEFLEYVNEANPPHDRPELAANIARFSMRAMDIAEAAGWKLANLSFSTGEPTHECWDVIAQTGFLERCAAGGHAIALHAYLDHRVPGDITHHLCRYRYLWDNHVLPRRLNIPMLLTELGPWRHLLTQIDALGFVTAVDNELRRDPYATGQLYTVSDIGTEEDYDRFWRNAYARFIRYAESVKDRANG